jgi:hypothetical protein
LGHRKTTKISGTNMWRVKTKLRDKDRVTHANEINNANTINHANKN